MSSEINSSHGVWSKKYGNRSQLLFSFINEVIDTLMQRERLLAHTCLVPRLFFTHMESHSQTTKKLSGNETTPVPSSKLCGRYNDVKCVCPVCKQLSKEECLLQDRTSKWHYGVLQSEYNFRILLTSDQKQYIPPDHTFRIFGFKSWKKKQKTS